MSLSFPENRRHPRHATAYTDAHGRNIWDTFTRPRLDAASLLANKDARAQAVDRELAALNTSLVRARRLRNGVVPAVCQLPVEILAIIFAFLQDIWPPERRDSSVYASKLDPGWMTAMQVCGIWRGVSTPMIFFTPRD